MKYAHLGRSGRSWIQYGLILSTKELAGKEMRSNTYTHPSVTHQIHHPSIAKHNE